MFVCVCDCVSVNVSLSVFVCVCVSVSVTAEWVSWSPQHPDMSAEDLKFLTSQENGELVLRIRLHVFYSD